VAEQHVGMTSCHSCADLQDIAQPTPNLPPRSTARINHCTTATCLFANKLDTLIEMTSVVASNLGKDGMFLSRVVLCYVLCCMTEADG
jgi:hypothetical protein